MGTTLDISLGQTSVLADTPEFPIGSEGSIGIQVLIHNGAGAAPTDAPAGTWELYASVDGQRFSRLTHNELATELARIAPNGNNLVDAWALVGGLPHGTAKLRYNRTSGGATARATVRVAVW